MTMTVLTAVIASFCQFKDPQLSKDYKIDCMEAMYNCSIVGSGETNEKLVEGCKAKWRLKSETK